MSLNLASKYNSKKMAKTKIVRKNGNMRLSEAKGLLQIP